MTIDKNSTDQGRGNPVAWETLTAWQKQIEEERCAWCESRETDRKVRDAYRAGIQQGMAEMVLTLEVQGLLGVKHMGKRYVQPGERVAIEAPYSEVCCHMQIAGKPMLAMVLPSRYAAQLYTPDGREFSAPVTPGEAGFYSDADGFYVTGSRSGR